MKLKHTPGPWEITGVNGHFIASSTPLISGQDWTSICCEVWGRPWSDEDKRKKETQANARLIAAAPEMLDALIFSYKHSIACGRSGGVTDSMKKAIETAIGLSIEKVIK